MKTYNGFTLLEMLMAMIISTSLLLMIEKLMLVQQTNLQSQLAWMNIYNKFYFAKEIIAKAVRTAGFIGCRKLTKEFSDNYPTLLTNENAIQINVKPYLLITRSYKLVGKNNKEKKYYLLADCEHAEVIQNSKPLQYQYQASAEYLLFQQSNFYLKKNSLYLQDESGKSDEVMSGVDLLEMKLDKKLLTVVMILNNEKNIGATAQLLELNNNKYYFNDGKLHKVFQFNIYVRE